MIVFWAVAGVLSAAAAGLILQSAAKAASHAGSEDPTRALYRRQLDEIDDLADRGLIADDERKSARAEAGRRLLAADAADIQPWTAGTGLRRAVLAAAVAAPLVAIGLYLAVGAPGVPDQPIAARIAAWRDTDPSTLAPPQLAAVLRGMVAERPNDPDGYRYLAILEGASDNPTAAARALRRAITLAPARADLWEMLGEALMSEAGGEMTPQARRAFDEALTRDPKAMAARFHIAGAQVQSGDKAAGIAAWRALTAELSPGDPRREQLQAAIAPVLALAVGLTLWGLSDSISFFYTPAQAIAAKPPVGRAIQLGGLVQPGSVAKHPDGRVEFVVADQQATSKIVYQGDLPDLFREGQGIVATGAFRNDGVFEAKQVLAKHDENYMPKEITKALKEQGEWRGEGAPPPAYAPKDSKPL